MRFNVLLLTVLFASGVFAQSPSVQSIVPVLEEQAEQYYHPRFSPDDSRLLLTKSNFHGLYDYHLDTGILKTVTDAMGAGHSPVFSKDGQTIYYRTSVTKNRRRYFSLVGYNTITSVSTLFEKEKRVLSTPQKLISGKVIYSLKNDIQEIEFGTLKKKAAFSTPFAQLYKSMSIRITNGEEVKTIQPKGKRLYLWPSVSPDGSKLLFTVAGGGTFISDLDGNILTELGYANAPSWSPDGKWVVYMKDRDDGYTFTGSDIYLASVYGGSELNISNTSNVIELYPSWSHDGQQIVCSTDTGAIYLINLEWK